METLLHILHFNCITTCILWTFLSEINLSYLILSYLILLQVNKAQLPAYFDIMLPILPNICNNYSIRFPTYHFPLIKHVFAKQRLNY